VPFEIIHSSRNIMHPFSLNDKDLDLVAGGAAASGAPLPGTLSSPEAEGGAWSTQAIGEEGGGTMPVGEDGGAV
jgi:hypothetical protein